MFRIFGQNIQSAYCQHSPGALVRVSPSTPPMLKSHLIFTFHWPWRESNPQYATPLKAVRAFPRTPQGHKSIGSGVSSLVIHSYLSRPAIVRFTRQAVWHNAPTLVNGEHRRGFHTRDSVQSSPHRSKGSNGGPSVSYRSTASLLACADARYSYLLVNGRAFCQSHLG